MEPELKKITDLKKLPEHFVEYAADDYDHARATFRLLHPTTICKQVLQYGPRRFYFVIEPQPCNT